MLLMPSVDGAVMPSASVVIQKKKYPFSKIRKGKVVKCYQMPPLLTATLPDHGPSLWRNTVF